MLARKEFHSTTFNGSFDLSTARMYDSLVDYSCTSEVEIQYIWVKNISKSTILGRLNQLFTNFNTDNCPEVIDDIVNLSIAK